MDFDPEKKLDAAAAAAIERRATSYCLAVFHVCAQYIAEANMLRSLLFEKGVLSQSDYDAAMQKFAKSDWNAFLKEMNHKVRGKAKEYLAHLGESEKGH